MLRERQPPPGSEEAVARLEHAAADPDAIAGGGLRTLHLAGRHPDLRILAALLDAGAALELRDRESGWTPLLHASHLRNRPAAPLFLERDAEATRARTGGITPLVMAAGNGMAGAVRKLPPRRARRPERPLGGRRRRDQRHPFRCAVGPRSPLSRPLVLPKIRRFAHPRHQLADRGLLPPLRRRGVLPPVFRTLWRG